MKILFLLLLGLSTLQGAKSVAYIYGDVAGNGDVPSGQNAPYDQMLLTDTGDTGLSQFKSLVEAQGYSISQHYDQATTLNAGFLASFDVVIFGLHQKIWSVGEQAALDDWIKAGGGILMYSDSAAGGFFGSPGVGIKNQTGQAAVNSILANYGMEVAVDQAGGTRAYEPDADSSNPIIWDQPVFEGEGVSPVAIEPNGPAMALISLGAANRVSNGNLAIDPVGVTIVNPIWAAIGLAEVEEGNVMALFDRQPIWNGGDGSDITKRDNEEILRRIVRYLARDYGNSPEWFQFECLSVEADFQISYRQWSGGVGQAGFDYVARNNRFALQQQDGLKGGDWRTEASLVEMIGSVPFGDNESERVTLRVLPDGNSSRWFTRLEVSSGLPPAVPTALASGDALVTLAGSAWLEGVVTDATGQTWTQLSGPGAVMFDSASSAQTTATFSATGTYQLQLTATGGGSSATALHTVEVVDSAAVSIAINCGGGVYAADTGISYFADQSFNGGGVDNFPGNPVARTNDDLLYNSARSADNTFTGYSVPVPNGSYLVQLQFAETFWETSGARVFDVSVEGALVIDDLDLVEEGGKWVAYTNSATISVSDGILNIDVAASANNPLMNGIVVVALP
ncbi:MAG: malectin domain-containing carbohydrate-binding protein [Roseibacillus sp.]